LKKNYYEEQVANERDPRKLYKEIKSLTGSVTRSSLIGLANSMCGGDLTALYQHINEYFASICQEYPAVKTTQNHSDLPVTDSFIISVEEVYNELVKLKPHKSPGPHGLPT